MPHLAPLSWTLFFLLAFSLLYSMILLVFLKTPPRGPVPMAPKSTLFKWMW